MPITKSAKKALRQNLKKRAHNIFYKNKIKALFKKVKSLILEKKIEEAKKLLPKIYKILDKAAKEKVIKKNTAARKKSRIAKLISRIKSELKSQ
jgi:small subunit ribosomal protein S20